MNEPIVTNLYYDFKLSSELAFNNPPPLEQELQDFKLLLHNNRLDIDMKREVQTEAVARSIVEPFLRSWELDHFLSSGRKQFWFEFKNSRTVDKKPDQTGNTVIHTQTGTATIIGYEPTIIVTNRQYPIPNFTLANTPDVESWLLDTKVF